MSDQPARPTLPVLEALRTADEAADVLRISEGYLMRLARQGDIRSVRIGRRVMFTDAAIAEFIAAHEVLGDD